MKNYAGFTLVEMAMVFLIIGLLIGGLLISVSTQIDISKTKNTEDALEHVKEALTTYVLLNNTLPCPASDVEKGVQDAANCSQEGYLPWADLGVSKYDAWGQPFRYRAVNRSSYGALDKIEVTVGNTSATNTSLYEKARALAVVFSVGKNGQADSENFSAKSTNTYRYNDFVPNGFDDNLIWLSPNNLANYVLSAGGSWPLGQNPLSPISRAIPSTE